MQLLKERKIEGHLGCKLLDARFLIWLLRMIFKAGRYIIYKLGVLKITFSTRVELTFPLDCRYLAFRGLVLHCNPVLSTCLQLGWMSENSFSSDFPNKWKANQFILWFAPPRLPKPHSAFLSDGLQTALIPLKPAQRARRSILLLFQHKQAYCDIYLNSNKAN